MRWSMATPNHQCFKICFWSLCNSCNRAVYFVLHPSCQAQGLGLNLGGLAVPHSLNFSADFQTVTTVFGHTMAVLDLTEVAIKA